MSGEAELLSDLLPQVEEHARTVDRQRNAGAGAAELAGKAGNTLAALEKLDLCIESELVAGLEVDQSTGIFLTLADRHVKALRTLAVRKGRITKAGMLIKELAERCIYRQIRKVLRLDLVDIGHGVSGESGVRER